jgi:hypothetical protein
MAEKLHNEALFLLDKANVEILNKNKLKAIEYKRQALKKEEEAASILELDYEPSRSILFRSAASIAFEIEDYIHAEKLVFKGLIGSPPEWVENELRELYESIHLKKHLSANGNTLSNDEFQMIFTGKGIGYGFAPIKDYIPRAESITKIILRTAQRKMYKQFDNRIQRDLFKRFTPYISVPLAASFAVTFKLAVPGGQIELFEDFTKVDILSEVFKCIELYEAEKDEEVKTIMDSEEFFDNFRALYRNVLPDGKNIRTVSFSFKTDNDVKMISIKKRKYDIYDSFRSSCDSSNILKGLKKGDPISFEGLLIIADKSTEEPQISVKHKDGLYKVIVPRSQMDDIVRPLWNRNVVIKGKKHSTRTVSLEAIESLEE